jgi:mRNA interferase MazF
VEFPAHPPGSTGGEIRRARPAVVVTAEGIVAHLNRVQVVPLTTQGMATVFPWESLVGAASTGHRPSKALASQVRTVAKERVGRYVGRLADAELAALDVALRRLLDL